MNNTNPASAGGYGAGPPPPAQGTTISTGQHQQQQQQQQNVAQQKAANLEDILGIASSPMPPGVETAHNPQVGKLSGPPTHDRSYLSLYTCI